MSRAPDYMRKKYGPLQGKTLHNALAHAIAEQFPRIGGPRVRGLCAEMILEVVNAHVRPQEHVRHGQVLWMGVATDHPPRYRQRLTDAKLVPVVLDLSTPEDIDARIDRKRPMERLQSKAVRLCHQSHQQGALLSNCDLAELLGTSDSSVALALTTYERQTEKLVPRRATLHDVGTGLTHKRIPGRAGTGSVTRKASHPRSWPRRPITAWRPWIATWGSSIACGIAGNRA